MSRTAAIIYILLVLASLIVGFILGETSDLTPSYVFGPTADADEMARITTYKGWFGIHFSSKTDIHYSDHVEHRTRSYGSNILFVALLYVVLFSVPFVTKKFKTKTKKEEIS